MKRSPLTRRTPLARGKSELKRTRLKPMSDAKKREKAATDPIRDAYREAAGGVCERCGKRRKLDVHEIAAGSHRHRAVYDPNCLLAVCRACHEEIQGAPFRVQLAIKCRACSEAINRATGRNVLTFTGVSCAEDANETKGF